MGETWRCYNIDLTLHGIELWGKTQRSKTKWEEKWDGQEKWLLEQIGWGTQPEGGVDDTEMPLPSLKTTNTTAIMPYGIVAHWVNNIFSTVIL